MRIAFRVDSSAAIGTGHLMRCLTLAQRLREQGADVLFVMRDLPGAMLQRPELAGFECAVLPPPSGGDCSDGLAHSAWLGTDQATDARETLAVLGNGVDWMVVDHYAIDRQWHSVVRQRAAKIMVIDDIADRSHDCDLLLDQNLQNVPDRYSKLVGPQCTTLLGPRYALLRQRFAELRSEALARQRGKLGRLLVFLGGVDAAGATVLALNALAESGLDGLPIDVVAGPANPAIAQIRAWCASRPNAELFEGEVELADLMLAADLSIGAAGSASWERCCMGLPTVVVTVAENQREGARAMAAAGAAIWAGESGYIAEGDLAVILGVFGHCPGHLTSLSAAATKLVDGEGVSRVMSEIINEDISVRRASINDCAEIYEWRNHHKTRLYFFNNKPIKFSDHNKWYNDSLEMNDRYMLFAYNDKGGVGVVRFDIKGEAAEVSIFLNPKIRSKGFGRKVLYSAINWLRENVSSLLYLDAKILPENQASVKVFASVGFKKNAVTYRFEL